MTVTAATTAAATALVVALAPAAAADPLPGGLGPCVGADCPTDYGEPNSGGVTGHDSNINVFVGGDYLVREAAAEAEGKIVTLGSFDMDKRAGASQIYNVGVVGGGSRVPPPNDSDYLSVGGTTTVADGQRLLAEEGPNHGVVRHEGALSGQVIPEEVRDSTATDPYEALRPALTEASHCYAYDGDDRRAPTGTVTDTGVSTLFTGDGTSPIQIFSVDADLVGPGGSDTDFQFAGIPSGATVLVNVYGSSRNISTLMGSLSTPELRQRLLWNFPDATTVGIDGSGQFQGSVLVGNPASTTTLRASGTNGRFYTAGNLTHSSEGESGGQELHAYPFDGDLPSCAIQSTESPTPTPTDTTPEPTPTDTTPEPTPSDSTPEPTPSETTPDPTPSETTPAPHPSPSRPSLPDTGADHRGEWILGTLAAALVTLGTATLLATRRSRRHRH